MSHLGQGCSHWSTRAFARFTGLPSLLGSALAVLLFFPSQITKANENNNEVNRRRRPNVGMEQVKRQLIGDCVTAVPGTASFFDCKHLERGVYGDYGMNDCMPSPRDTFSRLPYGTRVAPLPTSLLEQRDFGWHYYYSADISPEGKVRVYLRLHFKSALADDPVQRESIDRRLREAERIWNQNAPSGSFEFRFVRVSDRESAHYSLDYKPGWGRGPSHWIWHVDWNALTFAHEIGHLLGLHDEYAEFDQENQSRHCLGTSLMCDNWNPMATPRSYNYYVMLRRIFCVGTDWSGEGPIWPIWEEQRPAHEYRCGSGG